MNQEVQSQPQVNQQNSSNNNNAQNFKLIKFIETNIEERLYCVEKLLRHFFGKLLNSEEGGKYIASYYSDLDDKKIFDFFISMGFLSEKYKKSENESHIPKSVEIELKVGLVEIISDYYSGSICPSCIKSLANYVFKDKIYVLMIPYENLRKKEFFLVQPFDVVKNLLLCFYKNEPSIEKIANEEPILLDEENYDIITEVLVDYDMEEEEDYDENEECFIYEDEEDDEEVSPDTKSDKPQKGDDE